MNETPELPAWVQPGETVALINSGRDGSTIRKATVARLTKTLIILETGERVKARTFEGDTLGGSEGSTWDRRSVWVAPLDHPKAQEIKHEQNVRTLASRVSQALTHAEAGESAAHTAYLEAGTAYAAAAANAAAFVRIAEAAAETAAVAHREWQVAKAGLLSARAAAYVAAVADDEADRAAVAPEVAE